MHVLNIRLMEKLPKTTVEIGRNGARDRGSEKSLDGIAKQWYIQKEEVLNVQIDIDIDQCNTSE